MENQTLRLNWDDATVFLAVARTGTLTSAARSLGIGVATASRRVERLESALSIPLFARNHTGYKLTDQGAALLPRAELLEQAMLGFRAGAKEEVEVTGHVRLATAENLANAIIIPTLAPLLERHPSLTLEVATDISMVNLHRRDADLAVRMVRPTQGNVSVRRIGTLGYGLYGSPAYMAKRVGISSGESLENDHMIGWSERQNMLPVAQWLEMSMRGNPPKLLTTSLSAQVKAAVAGLGLAIIPHFLGQEAGLQLLPREIGVDQPIWLVIHNDLTASQRVRVVADHLVETIRRNDDRLRTGIPRASGE